MSKSANSVAGTASSKQEDPVQLNRRRFFSAAGGVLALAGLAACTSPQNSATAPNPVGDHAPAAAKAPSTPGQALEMLKTGNSRFAEGRPKHPNQTSQLRSDLAEHQEPWALVHGCVDSRVAPELVFDQGIGDLFVTRTAGAVLDDTLVGSMEFAVSSPYEVPVIVILGHTACGAVTGTVEALEKNAKTPKAPGEMIDFISEIAPAAREAEPVPDKSEHINNVVRMNTVAVAEALVERSEIIRAAVNAGRTEVIAAVYDLQTGLVDWNPVVA